MPEEATQEPSAAPESVEPTTQGEPHGGEPTVEDFDSLPEWARTRIAKSEGKLAQSVTAERNLRTRLSEAEPLIQEAAAAKEAQRTDFDRLQETASTAAEQAAKFRDRAVVAEAKVLAREFANPDVAVRLLGDLKSYVDEAGDIDTEKITVDLGGLLEREPYLGRTQEPREMKPNRAQGQSGGAPLTPGQLARDKEQQGDWKASSAIKSAQLLDLARKNNQ
jgi:hypothetical protein